MGHMVLWVLIYIMVEATLIIVVIYLLFFHVEEYKESTTLSWISLWTNWTSPIFIVSFSHELWLVIVCSSNLFAI